MCGDHRSETTSVLSGDALDLVSAGYLELDNTGTVRRCNQTATELLSVSSDELLGADLTTILSGTVLADVFAHSTEEFERYDDERGRWFSGTVTSTDDGFAIAFRDVTRRNELEREINRRQRQLEESTATLERLHAVVTNSKLSTEEKIRQLLEIGAERLDTAYGFLTRIEAETQRIVHSIGGHPNLEPGSTAPLSRAYCRRTIGQAEPLAVVDAPDEGWEDDPAYDEFGFDCYLGTTIYVDGEQYGTVCFADDEPRDGPFTDRERMFIEFLTDWIHYQLEQQSYQRELEAQQAFTESLIDSLPDPLYALDSSGELLRWNSRLEEVLGYDAADLDGMAVSELVVATDRDRVDSAVETARSGERVSLETTVETGDGRQIPYELSGAPLYDSHGEIYGVAGVGRDVSERTKRQEQLSGILSMTRSLMQARDREHVAEIAVNAARELLGFDVSVFRLYNSEAGTLEPAASTTAAEELLGDRPVYDLDSGYPGAVFSSGEPQIIPDVQADADVDFDAIRSALYYPVGVHGTISIGSTELAAFDEHDEQMLALLATSAAAACMRAKREQEVREAREHTERVLDRVNGLIENTVEVLVQATTREEIERGVVAQLARAEPYTFAWVGQPDIGSEVLTPTAWDGESVLSVQGRTFDLNRSGEPVSDVYNSGTPQLFENIDSETYGQWDDILAETDIEAFFLLPLAYKDATYGVLAVFADDASAFDERERVVLEALGRAVANAINAVERGRILDATEIIELEFAIDDPSLLFSRLSASGNCRIESVGTKYRPDGSIRLYLTASGVDPTEFLDVVRRDPETTEVTCIVAHEDECLLEVTVEESLLADLTEYGAVPQHVVASNGTARFTVELPYEAEARELFELVEKQYPGTDLLGYHERERPMETRQEFKSALSERLTDRQETALRTAYLGGFFDWPREVDGNELADAMDISRPTYHQHLRAAQAKVFEELFD